MSGDVARSTDTLMAEMELGNRLPRFNCEPASVVRFSMISLGGSRRFWEIHLLFIFCIKYWWSASAAWPFRKLLATDHQPSLVATKMRPLFYFTGPKHLSNSFLDLPTWKHFRVWRHSLTISSDANIQCTHLQMMVFESRLLRCSPNRFLPQSHQYTDGLIDK